MLRKAREAQLLAASYLTFISLPIDITILYALILEKAVNIFMFCPENLASTTKICYFSPPLFIDVRWKYRTYQPQVLSKSHSIVFKCLLFQTFPWDEVQDSEGERETREASVVSVAELRGAADDQGHRLGGGEVWRGLQTGPVPQDLHPQIRTSLNLVRWYQRIYR